MIKRVTKIGNSQGIIFDAALMDMAHLKVGDAMNLEIHSPSGTITLTPLQSKPSREKVSEIIKDTMRDYAVTMKKLA